MSIDEILTIINAIMAFALMVLIIISTRQDIKARCAINASLDILFKRQQLLAQDMDQLQKGLVQVQKGEVDNAKTIKATQEKTKSYYAIDRKDIERIEKDIAVMADLMAQIKYTAYHPNSRFSEDNGRILEINKRSGVQDDLPEKTSQTQE